MRREGWDVKDFVARPGHGHACGDYMLRELAHMVRGNVREIDLVARWGGEEFLLLLPETDAAGARVLIDNIRQLLATSDYAYQGTPLRITMTFGISELEAGLELEQWLARADEALYEGKKAGRDTAVVRGAPAGQ